MEKYAKNEAELQATLICCPPIPFTQLVGHEWMVHHHYSQFGGVGDLVFKRPGFEEYLVVETKYITTMTGRTARTSRRKARKKVQEQAAFYGRRWKQLHPQADVSYAWYTNDRGLSEFGWVPS